MAWSPVFGQESTANGAAAAIVAMANPCTAGNIVIAWLQSGNPVGNNQPNVLTGWTLLKDFGYGTGAGTSVTVWAYVAAGGETNFLFVDTAAGGSGNIIAICKEFSGGSVTLDGTPGSASGTGVTSVGTGSTTLSRSDSLIITACAQNGSNGGGNAWVNSTTVRPNIEARLFGGYWLPGSTGSKTDTGSWTTSRAAGGLIIGLKIPISLVSSTETGVATDAEGSLNAALSDAETGVATDAEGSLSGAVTDPETGHATETEAIAATVTDAETATATDAESVAIATSDNETGAATDAEGSLALAPTDPETGTATETETIAATVTDIETGSATDAESVAIATTDAETGSAADAEGTGLGVSDPDEGGSGDDAEAVALALAEAELAHAVDTALANVTFSDDDTALIAEGSVIVVGVTDGDTATATESESVDAQQQGGQGWLVGASFL